MTKQQQFNQEDKALTNRMDSEADRIRVSQLFVPVVGMEPKSLEGNGYKGFIEHVGRDYFILRSYRDGNPIFIRTFQYHNFKDYTLTKSVS